MGTTPQSPYPLVQDLIEGAKLAGEVQNVIVMPKAPAIVAPLIYAIPAQMLAYNTALARGTDVDQPRNLAKSVTVE